MVNGLLTLRGAWHKVADDAILTFFVVAITFYGMSAFEGPLLSIKSVNSLSHYTDWTIAHVHGGALGWVGFMTFGMAYWLMPRLFQTKLWSPRLMEVHFWTSTVGILLYVLPIYAAGLTQGLMWRAFDETGRLAYGDFVETTMRLMPMYWFRVAGGALYLTGTVLCMVNLGKTGGSRPARYEVPVHEAPALLPDYTDPEPLPSYLQRVKAPVTGFALRLERFLDATWHRRWERLPLVFTVWVGVAVIVASLFEIIPTFLIKSNVPTIESVKPYTPLELAGRDIYIAEGCNNCHSQMVRPIRSETVRYGEYGKPGEFVYEHPFLWGSRRIGPDLQRVGGKYPNLWHVRHMENPRSITPQSIMPPYPWMLTNALDFETIPVRMRALRSVGVPYTDEEIEGAVTSAREQADAIAREVASQGGREGLEDKEIVALVAYLQRLGQDIKAPPPVSPTPESAASVPEAGGGGFGGKR